jgi:alkylation response protein AidB-like acyl-CoA dehydrogenase
MTSNEATDSRVTAQRTLDLSFSADELAWRNEVRAFIAANVTDELRAEHAREDEDGRGPLVAEFHRKLGQRGWNATNWPKEYGGLETSAIQRLILMDELYYWRAPRLEYASHNIAPIIIRYGNESNKRTWLPRIARGEVTFALGYSEPDAGTDLASLRTTAVLDGDEWVINGTKIWNSAAHTATHEWLLVRTDPAASPPHAGLSVILMKIDSPGVEVYPLETWGDVRTNQIHLTDVRVPVDNLVGELNGGWKLVTGALDLERAAIGTTGELRRNLDDLIDYVKSSIIDGVRLSERDDVRRLIVELDAELDMASLLAYEVASLIDDGQIPTVEANMQKVWTSELRTRIADAGMQVAGLYGQLDRSDPRAPIGGRFEAAYRWAPIHRFGGGTNEVLRDIIAQRGFGLPRAPRRSSEKSVR